MRATFTLKRWRDEDLAYPAEGCINERVSTLLFALDRTLYRGIKGLYFISKDKVQPGCRTLSLFCSPINEYTDSISSMVLPSPLNRINQYRMIIIHCTT